MLRVGVSPHVSASIKPRIFYDVPPLAVEPLQPLSARGYWMYGRAVAVTFHLPPTPDRLSSRTTSLSR